MIETISQIILKGIESCPEDDRLLYKEGGKYVAISTKEFRNRITCLALGFKELGIEPGDKLVIFSENCPDWIMADLANLCIGGVSVPIYTSLGSEQVRYIIDNSDAKVIVFAGKELWQKIEPVKRYLAKVRHFISLKNEPFDGVLTAEEVQMKGKKLKEESPELFERLVKAVKPSDIASIIYTSGTTGIPKGVMLTHNNFVSNIKSVCKILHFSPKDTVLSFLPLSHVFERMVTFTYLYRGCTIAYAESIEAIGENLLEIRPHIMVGVPRVFEKIFAKVMDNVLASSGFKKKIFFWAERIGKEYEKRRSMNLSMPFFLRFKRSLAHRLVFSKIIEKTGERVRFFVSGGAPLSKNIAEFFYALGLVVLEGYGLTETSPVISVNTFKDLKFGTVGKPIPGIEVKIADDGEILTRGPHVMKGYYKLREETQDVLKNGWLHTGDIGYIDEDGFLVITDRKKNIIITAGGKNVAPQYLENILKANRYIANAVVIGDKRKFISALVVPSFEKIEHYARKSNIPFDSHRDLIRNQEIVTFLESEIGRYTSHLATYEQVKKIILLDRDFEIEKGEMTPSLKVRRNIVEEKYRKLIDRIYEEPLQA